MPRVKLVRPTSKKMIAGVCAGLADYFGVETRKVRIGFVLFGLFGAGEIVYIALWIMLQRRPNPNLVYLTVVHSTAAPSCGTL
ncbi:hypothetical protein BH20ACT23_BH20ACT23_16450 [soil metagenome]